MKNISGFWQIKNKNKDVFMNTVQGVTRLAEEKGDNAVFLTDETRLSALGCISDKSSAENASPVKSSNGRYLIIFSGELYNLAELKSELETDVSFLNESFEECVLHGIEVWGLEKTLQKMNGVFAFVVWDNREEKYFFARDKIGAKNIYYGVQNGTLFFATSLTSLRMNSLFSAEIDKNVLSLFFRYCYIPVPYSIYKDIKKLEQGFYMSCDRDFNFKKHCYWNALDVTVNGKKNLCKHFEVDAVLKTENILKKAVSKRMENKEKTGVFLSGGIDSSLIAALAQKQSELPVRTFSMGLSEKKYDETVGAEQVAKHLGAEHATFFVTPDNVLQVIPKMPDIYDEPFSDSSQIPTFMLLSFVGQHVKTGLTGDGGDEVFGGYNRYLWADNIWNKIEKIPYFAKAGAAGLIKMISPNVWDKVADKFSGIMPGIFNYRLFGDKLHKLAGVLTSRSQNEMYLSLASHWKNPEKIVLGAKEPETLPRSSELVEKIPDFVERMMFMDLMTYLPDDGVVKVVKAAESAGVNARSPILDPEVVEFSKTLPMTMKIKNGKNKWILREILYKYVPFAMVDRPKMGFGVPIDAWLRGPLKKYAENLLDEKQMKKDGILNVALVQRLWREHLRCAKNNAYDLWDVIMFQAWKNKWM
ncbi:MAG: asparagine synthase (glutamine-hydrolyzing) [Candidatus Omnitrophota bacterium]